MTRFDQFVLQEMWASNERSLNAEAFLAILIKSRVNIERVLTVNS